jgi:membrane-associated protease RseP (regulator of RpoE activity)
VSSPNDPAVSKVPAATNKPAGNFNSPDEFTPGRYRQSVEGASFVPGPPDEVSLSRELGAAPPYRRRILLPVVLFLLTCLTTFYAGFTGFPGYEPRPLSRTAFDGLFYSAAVMTILMSHEMGHFLQALRYRVPASLPFFIPIPIGPLGTMGAVIGMQGSQADRRQLFDIGISGPLAGMILVVPVLWLGLKTGTPDHAFTMMNKQIDLGYPLLMKWMIPYAQPGVSSDTYFVTNPLLMAGWVGCFVTGLNMLPISQLDGGHVSYAVFGRYADLVANWFFFTTIGYIIIYEQHQWILMLLIVMMIGIHHPPTANDDVPIGWPRRVLGLASLGLSAICLPINLNPFS